MRNRIQLITARLFPLTPTTINLFEEKQNLDNGDSKCNGNNFFFKVFFYPRIGNKDIAKLTKEPFADFFSRLSDIRIVYCT